MDGSVISRRSLLSLPVAAGFLALFGRFPSASAAVAEGTAALPILPLNTNFSHWDHHWIQWIDHPVYEAIEVALAERTGGQPLVRLWLTERADGKRQVYYFNDQGVARTFPQESHFADITVEHRGEPDFARSLSLAFADKDGVPIRWEMNFPAGQRLSTERAGLKPQNGHGARTVLLFWYVDRRADAGEGRLLYGDDEYVVRDAGARPDTRYLAAYNAGAYVGIISYGSGEISPTADGFRNSWAGGRLFERRPAGGRTLHTARFSSFGRPSTIELGTDADGLVLNYRHEHDGRSFALDFDPPLDVLGGNSVGFRLAIEGHPVAHGTVTAVRELAQGRQLRWEFTDPDWAREVGLSTLVSPRADGGYAMRVSPLH